MKVAQLCLTFCDPRDYQVHGILQARILEWVSVSFSKGASQPKYQIHIIGDSLPTEPLRKALIIIGYFHYPIMEKNMKKIYMYN